MNCSGRHSKSIPLPTKPAKGSEKTLVPFLVVNGSNETCRGRDLPVARRLEIERQAQRVGMDLMQALSLRRQLIRAITPTWKYYATRVVRECIQRHLKILFFNGFALLGTLKSANASFPAVAVAVAQQEVDGDQRIKYMGDCFCCEKPFERHLSFCPTIDRIAACPTCRAKSIPLSPTRHLHVNATPDILFVNPVMINGRAVNWIDLKAYYASHLLVTEKRYQKSKSLAIVRLRDKNAKYNAVYGPGALLFLRGFHGSLVSYFSELSC